MALLDALLDGMTGAGLFGRFSWPGAPTEFIDSRTPAQFDARSEAMALHVHQLVDRSSRELNFAHSDHHVRKS